MRKSILTKREPAAGSRTVYRAPAAEKSLDILELMAGQPEGLTQTEIAAGLGRSLHEIYRVLLLLEDRGYLVRTRADRFRLSLKLFTLAHRHPPINRLVECGLPVMRTLATDADQSCHLAVRDDLHVLVVLQIDSPLPMRYMVALGSRFPLLETSSGAVLLAHLDRPERDRVVARIIAAGAGQGTRAEVDRRLDEVERLGCEVRRSLAVESCTNISAPVRDHTGAVIAALTVPFLPQKAARFDVPSVFERLNAAAAGISTALGAAASA